MGIIDSLSAGYRLLVKRLELLLLPLLLDAFLWFAPRLSIEPLLKSLAAFYTDIFAQFGDAAEAVGPGLAELPAEVTKMMDAVGRSFNLFDLLVSSSLYHVPSLLVTLPGLKTEQTSQEIASLLNAGGSALLLGLVGLLLGVVYMNLLARIVPLGEGEKSAVPSRFVATMLRHWLRSVGFLMAMFVFLLMLYIPTAVGVTVLMLISPALGAGAMMLMGGLVTVIFFYLYFVTVGLVLDNLSVRAAVMRSIVLVRNNFWSTLGFFLLTNLISVGITLLLREIVAVGVAGVVVGALTNAFVGTGLAMALLIFYRTRLIVTSDKRQAQKT
ncbi:MAG: hypothetical protein HY328_05650 [Chloroflexi bacterium]|nr:hypothetical protein [Chloroflexota bacterium]